jgi:hypothetical protein
MTGPQQFYGKQQAVSSVWSDILPHLHTGGYDCQQTAPLGLVMIKMVSGTKRILERQRSSQKCSSRVYFTSIQGRLTRAQQMKYVLPYTTAHGR